MFKYDPPRLGTHTHTPFTFTHMCVCVMRLLAADRICAHGNDSRSRSGAVLCPDTEQRNGASQQRGLLDVRAARLYVSLALSLCARCACQAV